MCIGPDSTRWVVSTQRYGKIRVDGQVRLPYHQTLGIRLKGQWNILGTQLQRGEPHEHEQRFGPTLATTDVTECWTPSNTIRST